MSWTATVARLAASPVAPIPATVAVVVTTAVVVVIPATMTMADFDEVLFIFLLINRLWLLLLFMSSDTTFS